MDNDSNSTSSHTWLTGVIRKHQQQEGQRRQQQRRLQKRSRQQQQRLRCQTWIILGIITMIMMMNDIIIMNNSHSCYHSSLWFIHSFTWRKNTKRNIASSSTMTTTNLLFRSQQHNHIKSVIISKPAIKYRVKRTATWCLYSMIPNNNNNNQQQQHYPLYTQVISDVDDTLKSSGGINVAGIALGGIDVQYERGSIYPGVAEFILQMSIGINSNSMQSVTTTTTATSTQIIIPKVAILTARAEEFKLALELKDDNPISIALREAGANVGINNWGIGPVLFGSVSEWIIQNRKGLRKFTNFERLIQQDITGMIFQYVYIGDTGEYDLQAGETMLREYPEIVKAVFLHVVSSTSFDYYTDNDNNNNNQDYYSPIDIPPMKLINGRPIIFFRTYVGAAVSAVQFQFITIDALIHIIEVSCEQLSNVPKSSTKWIDLYRDINRANQLLLLQ